MNKYRCTVCGWIYDPKVGDPGGEIVPGTPFEDIFQISGDAKLQSYEDIISKY